MISAPYSIHHLSFEVNDIYDKQLLKTIYELQLLGVTALQLDEWLTEKLKELRISKGQHPE